MSPYRQHLQSDHWREIRREAAERSEGLCELCGAVASETHHVRYPRGYANDSSGNVLHVCSQCHRKSHGMRKLTTDLALRPFEAKTFNGRTFAGAHIDDCSFVWASSPSWFRALVVPTDMQARLLAMIIARANAREREGNGESLVCADPKTGDSWFKWAAIDDGLDEWRLSMRARRDKYGNTITPTESERFLAANYEQARRWGQRLQQDEMVRRIRAPQTGNVVPMTDSDRMALVLREIGILTAGNVEKIGAIDGRLTLVEQKVQRAPDEFITAKAFCLERGVDPDEMLPGMRIGPAMWLGNHLTRVGAEKGPKREWRMHNSARIESLNTYRRADLDAAFKTMPKD